MKKGVAVTGKGSLPCKSCIIHMAVPDTTEAKAWIDLVTGVLRVAEEKKLKSISFPAIGTGYLFHLLSLSSLDCSTFFVFWSDHRYIYIPLPKRSEWRSIGRDRSCCARGDRWVRAVRQALPPAHRAAGHLSASDGQHFQRAAPAESSAGRNTRFCRFLAKNMWAKPICE